jgi:hypothetical protein
MMVARWRGIGVWPPRTGIDFVAVTVGLERIGQQTTNTRIAGNGPVVVISGWLGIHVAILVVTR